MNQISPGQPVMPENASRGWGRASDRDDAGRLRDKASRFWSNLPNQLTLGAAALLVVALALALPTTRFFGDHMLGQGLVLPSGLLDWPFRAGGTLLRHRPLLPLSVRVGGTRVNRTRRLSRTSTRK